MNKYIHLQNMAPLLVQVELTEACNLKCRFCYNSQQPKYNRNVFKMLDVLAEQGVMQVTLTGGEPLMHPDFFKILSYATKKFPNVMILSNGALMNERVVEEISDSGVMSVSVSIHGDREIHDSLTGIIGSYEKSMNAIKKYLAVGKTPIASNFVLNAYNVNVLEKTAKTFHEIGLNFMTITRFVPVGIGKSASFLEINSSDMIKAMEFADKFMKEYENPHIEFAEAIPHCAVPKHLEYLANTCSYGYDRFYVDVNGDMMVCGLSRIPLGGNILTTPISEIKKNSFAFNSFISNEHVPENCARCHIFEKCHGGCRAAAMRTGEWRKTKDSFCCGEE